MTELSNELRERYATFISGIELERIRISAIEARVSEYGVVGKDAVINARLDQNAKFRNLGDDRYEIVQEWRLESFVGSESRPLMSLKFDLAVNIRSKKALEEDVFTVYASNNLILNTWPYVREFVGDITARMELPRLTLPFFKALTP